MTKETRNLLGQLNGKLWLYTELIFPRWHNLGHEFHGPYPYRGKKLLIKHWHDLNTSLWQFSQRFPYAEIDCHELYAGVKVELDIHNRLLSDKPIIHHTSHFLLKVDGKIVRTTTQIKTLIETLDRFIHKGIGINAKSTKSGVLVKNAEVEFYTLKNLADTAGMEWKPPKECYGRIQQGKLSNKELQFLDRHRKVFQNIAMINKIYDPRKPSL